MEELKRIIDDSEITKEDDALWPPPDRVGRQVGSGLGFFFLHCTKVSENELQSSEKCFCLQELEIVIGDEHISFTTSKIGSLIDVNQSK